MRRLPIVFTLVALTAAAEPAPQWVLDLKATELAVKVFKTGAGSSLAHDHVVVATKVTGKGTLDEAGRPESLTLELAADVNSLTPDEPDARRKYHLPNTPVPENDRKKIRDNMLAEGQLDAEKFKDIRFVVTRVYAEESGVLQCLGKLTLHGVTRELLFPIKVTKSESEVAADGSVRFKTSDFGIKPYSAALGLIKNKDEVELFAHVVMSKKTEAAQK